MRASEFLNETLSSTAPGEVSSKKSKLRKDHYDAIPGMETYTSIPGMYYGMYRFGIHMAGSPNNGSPQQGPTSNEMVTLAYTDVEQDIIDHSAKQMGFKRKSLSSPKSKELDTTNKTSPIASIKRNRYGI